MNNNENYKINLDKDFVETDYSTLEEEIGLRYPLRSSITGKAVTERKVVNVPDLESPDWKPLYHKGEYFPTFPVFFI